MQDIDTGKLRDILEIMKEFGASYLKADGLEIGFADAPTPTRTDVQGVSVAEAEPAAATDSKTHTRVTGYNALFGETLPRFPTAG